MARSTLSASEQERYTILMAAIQGRITNALAAKQLNISIRHVKRMKSQISKHGKTAVIHRLKGRPSNHRIADEVKGDTIFLLKERYSDFKPTLATEKLDQIHGIHISPQTTRRWMHEQQLWKIRRKKEVTYRSWRPRKEYVGELVQFDGSYHYWFEGRYVDAYGNPIETCLLAAIDDATGAIVKAIFAENEGTVAVFMFWKEYIQEYGRPIALYLDAFCTYKINHKAAVDNKELMTQFQRAMQALSITVITAHSAEAKGRIERLFATLQDRLVKEMRLAQINTPKQGNQYLTEVFIPLFNNKFSVIPAKEGNLHKRMGHNAKQLQHIFSVHDLRRINRDFTIQHKNKWYQLAEVQPTTIRASDQVRVETWLDESIHILFKDIELNYFTLPAKPKKKLLQPAILTTHKLNYKPPPDHPWRKKF